MINVKKYTHWLILGFPNWERNTHAYACHPRNSKISLKILKSNSQGIEPKYWYPRNQHESVAVFLKVKIAYIKKLCLFLFPDTGIQPLHDWQKIQEFIFWKSAWAFAPFPWLYRALLCTGQPNKVPLQLIPFPCFILNSTVSTYAIFKSHSTMVCL